MNSKLHYALIEFKKTLSAHDIELREIVVDKRGYENLISEFRRVFLDYGAYPAVADKQGAEVYGIKITKESK